MCERIREYCHQRNWYGSDYELKARLRHSLRPGFRSRDEASSSGASCARKRLSAVRWGVVGNMVTAWILTGPITAVLAAIICALLLALGLH